MKPGKHRRESGVALVVTVIVVAMLAVVGVAFMQSASVDRSASRSVSAILRAELAAQAGLSAGAAAVGAAITNGRVGQSQWNYASGHLGSNPDIEMSSSNTEADSFAFISQLDPSSGKKINTAYLASSSSGGSNTLIPIAGGDSEPAYPGQWVYLSHTDRNGNAVTNARYAFWVADDTTKLNPNLVGTALDRSFSTDASSLRLLMRDIASARTPGSLDLIPRARLLGLTSVTTNAALGHWDSSAEIRRTASNFCSLGTVKLAVGADLAPEQSLENDMALETLSAPTAPNGRPKINLARLKSFIDSLPKSQEAGNLRFQAVLDILDSSKTNSHKNWGGGDLSFLLNAGVMGGKYTETEARQLVANIFDAMDEDFIPICDNAANPNILGTEMRKTAGGVQGHPSIVYAGTGHYAGLKLASGVSVIRTHLALGFANPWPTKTEPWSKYTIDMQVDPSDPQFPTLTSENAEELASTPSSVGAGLPPRSGYLFPCGSPRAPHYSARNDITGEIKQVNNLTLKINRARLIYKSTEGDFVVAVVPGSPTLQALPSTVPNGGDGKNRFAWEPNRQSYWMRNDPRLHAKQDSWVIVANGAGGAATGTIPGPSTAIQYMSSKDQGDGAQGLSGVIDAGMNSTSMSQWYRSPSATNHFSMDESLGYTGGSTKIASSGFLGYLSVGKPWQTVTFHARNANNPVGQEDWKILDYVYSGEEIPAGRGVLHADMRPGKTYGPDGERAGWPGALSLDGSINANSLNWNTWRAIFEGVPSIKNASITSLNILQSLKPPLDNKFDFLRSIDFSEGATTDFERERVLRYIADVVVSSSRSFTVYAVGESIRAPSSPNEPFTVQSRSTMRAPLRVGLNTNTGGVRLQLQRPNSF